MRFGLKFMMKSDNIYPICRLCGAKTNEHQKVLTKFIIKQYREKFGILVNSNRFKSQEIKNYKCQECAFVFFDEKEGDSEFYEACKKSGKYFESWRWEFSIVIEKLKELNPLNRHLDLGSGTGVFSSSISGFIGESWAFDFVTPEISNPNVYFAFANSAKFETVMDKSLIKKVDGNLYKYEIEPGFKSEIEGEFSELSLIENGKPLAMRASSHDSIKEKGGGRYSHWGNTIYFSSEDNSDPRSNKSVYKLESTTLEDSYFDSISIFHTIEHVANPVELLLEIKKRLKIGGRLFISVPNANSEYRKHLDGSNFDNFDILNYPPHHLSWWRPQDLISLAKVCDLKPIRIYFEILGSNSIKSTMLVRNSLKSRSIIVTENRNELFLNGISYAKFLDCDSSDLSSISEQGFAMLIELQNL
jgi:SAM-dependent methyltransferase